MKKNLLAFALCICIGIVFIAVFIEEEGTPTIHVSYDQIMNGFNSVVSMERGPVDNPTYRKPNYIGMSSDGSVMIQIIGNKKDVSETSIMIAVPKDDFNMSNRNMTFLIRFLENVAPNENWGSWINVALNNMITTGKPEIVEKENCLIKLSPTGSGIFSLVVKPIESIER